MLLLAALALLSAWRGVGLTPRSYTQWLRLEFEEGTGDLRPLQWQDTVELHLSSHQPEHKVLLQ